MNKIFAPNFFFSLNNFWFKKKFGSKKNFGCISFYQAEQHVSIILGASIKVKWTPRPLVLTIKSILDGDSCLHDKCCMCKCLWDSSPKILFLWVISLCAKFHTFLLRKFMRGFLLLFLFLLFAKVKSNPSPRPETGVWQ